MDIDTELDGMNGTSLGQTAPATRSARQSAAAIRKVTVKLSEQISKRLEAAADRPGVGKSMVVEAALERFLDPAPPNEGLIHEALARIANQLERLDGDVRIVAETVALHARYHLTVTPQQDNKSLPATSEVEMVSGAVVDPKFRYRPAD